MNKLTTIIASSLVLLSALMLFWLVGYVNKPKADGYLPLSEAIKYDDISTAKILLALGADINMPDKYGDTPFYTAMKENPRFAKTLLDKKPNLDGKPRSGHDYIHLAVLSGDLDLVKYFLNRGANLKEENEQLDTACAIAVRINPEIMNYLASVDKTCFSDLASGYARSDEDVTDFQRILLTGVNINEKDAKGKTPLQIAVAYSQRKMVRFLLQNGADPNVEDQNFSVLYEAVGHGDMKIVGMLLDSGADINKRNPSGTTPVFASSDLERIKYLVSRGANLNVRDNKGRSPLENIVERNFGDPDASQALQTLCTLVALGASLEQKDIDELTTTANLYHKPEIAKEIVTPCSK